MAVGVLSFAAFFLGYLPTELQGYVMPHRGTTSPSPWATPVIPSSEPALSLAEIALDDSWRPTTVEKFNEHHHKILDSCISGGACAPNADKLVILGWSHFRKFFRGFMGGENVWCDAIVDALHALGYSMLIADGKDDLIRLFRMYHKETHLVLWSNDQTPESGNACMRDLTCTHQNPAVPLNPPNATHINIPLWKILSMHWWEGAEHPYGGPFTLAPEDYPKFPPGWGKNNRYIGYSLEKTCLKTPSVDQANRPRQAYILSKRYAFFADHDNYIFRTRTDDTDEQARQFADFYGTASKELNSSFVGHFDHDADIQLPSGITELPRLSRPEFQNMTAQSRVVLGIGLPFLSPSPWEVLCLGVPFINPIKSWNAENPDDRSQWWAQHRGILHLGIDEPYVYHVKARDVDGFERAIKLAMETPIPRFIPPQMKMSAFIDRIKDMVEVDWAGVAQQQIDAGVV